MRTSVLKRLCEALGPPGAEHPVREIFLEEARDLFEEITEDPLGNVLLHRPGPGPRVLLDAHLDEVAFMVAHLEKGGFLRVVPLGGVDPRAFYGQRVVVLGKKPLPGVVATHPPHLGKDGHVPEIEDQLVDLGLSEDRVQELVSVGDYVVFAPYFQETESAFLAKALDDRVGLFVILEALQQVHQPQVDLWVAASVQEEMGLRGAQGLAAQVEAEAVLVLEGTLANDLPGVPAHQRLACVGKGPEIRLSDGRFLADRAFSLALADLAREKGLPHQVVVKRKGGTNAATYQITPKARRVAAVSVPVRYLHGAASLASKADVKAACALLAAFLEEAPKILSRLT